VKHGGQSENICSVGPVILSPDVLVQVLLFCVARAEQIMKQSNTRTMTTQGVQLANPPPRMSLTSMLVLLELPSRINSLSFRKAKEAFPDGRERG